MKKVIILLVLLSFICIGINSQDIHLPEKTQIFFDDFESYIPGGQLVCQNPEDWTTWNNLPCTYQDPYITDTVVNNTSQSVILVDSNDLVKPIDNYTEGRYRISFKMFVPDGFYGYFNTLQIFDGINSEYGMQVFFEDNSTAYCDGVVNTSFNYTHYSWFENDIIVDLDNDHAKYFYNSMLIDEWQWSQGGSFSGINQLAGSEFYPWTNVPQGVAKFYIDDYQIEELQPIELLPPFNLNLETSGSDIILNWDSPYGGDWLYWDYGNTGNGIGTNGDSIFIASRWDTADLAGYNGFYLSKIKFFAQSNTCTYSLRVWIGENSPTLMIVQDVPEFATYDWNEIVLNNPVLIDASQELWFGYVCTSQMGEFPAACDDGPAIPYKGDMIAFNPPGSYFVSMSVDYGLDYNWNVAGFVTETKDSKEIAKPLVKNNANQHQPSIKPKLISKKSEIDLGNFYNKYLQGYNIYHSFNWGPYVLFDFTTEKTWTHEDLPTGHYAYYVTALYDEGESVPSDTVSAFLTNINENKINDIRISPNPAKDFVQVESRTEIHKILLFDLNGRIKKEITGINKTSLNFTVDDLIPGVYLLRMETENRNMDYKLVIQ